mgnify:CR=1 FL=1|jgi:hypothetical protein|tara:strand:- start:739 stop:1038 length:300 start_codon:yes stop_codon:yes gene_type:complete
MYLIPLVRTSRAITVCTLLPNNPLLSVAISEIASFIVPFIYNYPNDIFNSAFLFAYYYLYYTESALNLMNKIEKNNNLYYKLEFLSILSYLIVYLSNTL